MVYGGCSPRQRADHSLATSQASRRFFRLGVSRDPRFELQMAILTLHSFLCLMAYVIGVLGPLSCPVGIMPRNSSPLPGEVARSSGALHQPRPFGLKEHAISSILSTSSGNGAAIVQVFGAERL